MTDFIARCKEFFSQSESDKKNPSIEEALKRVDAQIGRAITRLSER